MVNWTNVFRQINGLGLEAEFAQGFPPATIGRVVGRLAFPVRHQYLHTHEQRIRTATTLQRTSDVTGRSASVHTWSWPPQRFTGFRAHRRIDLNGRIMRIRGSPSGSSSGRWSPNRSSSEQRRSRDHEHQLASREAPPVHGDSARVGSGGTAPSGAVMTGSQPEATTPAQARSAVVAAATPLAGDETSHRRNRQQSLNAAFQNALLLERGLAMLEEQREIVGNLERNRESLDNQAVSLNEHVRRLVQSDTGHARTVRRIRRDLQQAQMGAAYHRTALEVAQLRLSTGESRLAEFQADAISAINVYLRHHGTVEPGVDDVVLQERLFGVRVELASAVPDAARGRRPTRSMPSPNSKRCHVPQENNPFRRGKRPIRSKAAKALQGQVKDIVDSSRGRSRGDVKDATSKAREAAVDAYLDARASLDNHRDNYRQMRRQHVAGTNPGLPDWSAEWTREDFDVAHLAEWMRLSEALREVHALMRRMLQLATETGLEPLPHQEYGFWQPGSLGYSPSVEQAMIDNAPEAEILSWDDGVPMNQRGLVESIAIRDSRQTNGQSIDWPQDEQIFEPAPNLIPGDSASCVALEYEQERNETYAGPRPEGWNVTAQDRKPEPANNKQLMSHFC